MYGFLHDSVANFILMKKFKIVLSWFYSVRSYERLMSFKKWIWRKYMDSYQKITPVVNKDLTFFLRKLKLSKYVRFGTSFFLTMFKSGYSKRTFIDFTTYFKQVSTCWPYFWNLLYKWVMSPNVKECYKKMKEKWSKLCFSSIT